MKIHDAIRHQYLSGLRMLRRSIEVCPETLWLEGRPNRFWHVAYHTLFYARFYLSKSDAAFVPWTKQRADYNFLGAVPSRPDFTPTVDIPYTQTELLELCDLCMSEVEIQVPAFDLEEPSGFFWLPMDKLELQLYSIRHIAHHTGQLVDRLRNESGIGVPWTR
jgi:hypothetical protein